MKIRNDFQKKLFKDIGRIKSSKTPADKTSNIYRLNKGKYNDLLRNAITATYKKADNRLLYCININGQRFAKNAIIFLRKWRLMDKDNFDNNPTICVINPAKNEIGRISKIVLDKINKVLCQKLKVNQWKSMATVVEWFKAIENKLTQILCV